MSTTSSILQQLNSIPNPGGIGLPIQQYASTLQSALTNSLESVTNNEISVVTASQNALTSLQSALAQFQSATDALASSQSWSTPNVLSSNPAAVSATASPGALPATYTIAVGQLATSQVNFSLSGMQASASTTSSLTGGTIDITPASTGVTLAVTVTSGESLDAIAQAINAVSTLVQASIVDTGSGSTPYDLIFQSTQTGSLSAFTLTDGAGSTLVSSQLDASTPTQLAQNAIATLDGSISIQSSSNTFSTAIPNVTFTALQANTTATLSITSDTSSVVSNVQTWMNSYNSLVDLLSADTAYTPPTTTLAAQTGALFTDINAHGLISQLPSTAESDVGNNAMYQDLAAVGIVLDPTTGHLEFQSTTSFDGAGGTQQAGQTLFMNALNSNPSAVQSLFGVVPNSSTANAIPASGMLGNMWTLVNGYGTIAGTGSIGEELTSMTSQLKSLNSYLQTTNQQIQQQVSDFTSQLSQLNATMARTQAQMQTVLALIGGTGSSGSSGSSTPVL